MDVIVRCTPKMVTEGARALDLWSDESLREEIDGRRMAELVWKAMALVSDYQGAVEAADALLAAYDQSWLVPHMEALRAAIHPGGQ